MANTDKQNELDATITFLDHMPTKDGAKESMFDTGKNWSHLVADQTPELLPQHHGHRFLHVLC